MRRPRASVLVIAALATACDWSAASPESGRLLEERIELQPGATGTLTYVGESAVPDQSLLDWTSRDPSVATVVHGRVTAAQPGMTYVTARHRGVMDSTLVVVPFQLAEGHAAIRLGASGVRAFPGSAVVTATIVHGDTTYSTSVLAALPCCDAPEQGAMLQINLVGQPAEGVRHVAPPVASIEKRLTDQLVRSGAEDILIITGYGTLQRFFLPVRAARLEVVEVRAPGGSAGMLRGRVAFEAAGLLQTTSKDSTTYTPIGTLTTPAYAEFVVPLTEREFRPPIPAPPSAGMASVRRR